VVKMIYSQSAEKRLSFVRQFIGRTFYVNAVAKIMGPIDTWEFGSGILWGEGAGIIVHSLRRPFITLNE